METYKKLIKAENEEAKELYIALATQAALDYTNRTELIPPMNALVVELANYYVVSNTRAGIASRSEGAISESYIDYSGSDGIPGIIKARLDRYKLLHAVKHRG